eukprot:1362_1
MYILHIKQHPDSIMASMIRIYNPILKRYGFAYIPNGFKTSAQLERLCHSVVYKDTNAFNHASYGAMGSVSRELIGRNPNVIDVGSTVPNDVTVFPHNEMGYDPYHVRNYIFFGCFHPALQGGTTTISDVRQ